MKRPVKSGGMASSVAFSGTLYAWGQEFQRLDPTPDVIQTTPVRIGSQTGWTTISAGGEYALLIRRGQLWGFGKNASSQFGNGTTNTFHPLPIQTSQLNDWTLVDASGINAYGIRSGQLFGWGAGGVPPENGEFSQRSTPTRIGGASDWTWVSTSGSEHTAGIRNGRLYAWGSNDKGQIGNGESNVDWVSTPTLITNFTDWSRVECGGESTMGIRDGKLYAWGDNENGQLGLGFQSSKGSPITTPTQVGSATGWESVALGRHSLGIRAGELYAWGRNDFGQLGDGTTTERLSPVRIGTDNDWSDIAVGRDHALAVRNGRLYAWGRNNAGQLGDGTTVDRLTPTQIGTKTIWSFVAASDDVSIAVI